MSSADSPSPPVCFDCGATLGPRETKCWLCGAAVAVEQPAFPAPLRAAPLDAAPTAAPFPNVRAASRKPPPIPLAPLAFSLSTLFLILTMFAVWCGLIVAAPGLGIPLAIASVPALIRTSMTGRRARHVGQQLSAGDKVAAFLASIGVVAVIGLSGFIAFAMICFPLGAAAFSMPSGNSALFMLALGGGGIAGLAAAFFVGRRLW